MSFEVNQHVGAFARSLGNGPAALANIVEAVEQVSGSNSRDTTVFVRQIERAEEKQDRVAAQVVKLAVRHVFVGAKFGKDKNGRARIKIAGIQPDADARAKLAQLVQDGVSIRSPKVREAFKTDGDDKVRDKKAVASSAIRAAKKNKVSKKDLIALIEAEWNNVKLDA